MNQEYHALKICLISQIEDSAPVTSLQDFSKRITEIATVKKFSITDSIIKDLAQDSEIVNALQTTNATWFFLSELGSTPVNLSPANVDSTTDDASPQTSETSTTSTSTSTSASSTTIPPSPPPKPAAKQSKKEPKLPNGPKTQKAAATGKDDKGKNIVDPSTSAPTVDTKKGGSQTKSKPASTFNLDNLFKSPTSTGSTQPDASTQTIDPQAAAAAASAAAAAAKLLKQKKKIELELTISAGLEMIRNDRIKALNDIWKKEEDSIKKLLQASREHAANALHALYMSKEPSSELFIAVLTVRRIHSTQDIKVVKARAFALLI